MPAAKLSTNQLTQLFNVTPLTIYHWRKGTASKSPLPTAKPTKGMPPNAVVFELNKVLAWAKKNAVPVAPDNVMSAAIEVKQAQARRGPKPRA